MNETPAPTSTWSTLEFDRAHLETLPFHVAPCQCVRYHHPQPATVERHHIFPQGLQQHLWGEVRDLETVPVCGTCHNNVHAYIDASLAGRRTPRVGRYAEKLAINGLTRYKLAREAEA